MCVKPEPRAFPPEAPWSYAVHTWLVLGFLCLQIGVYVQTVHCTCTWRHLGGRGKMCGPCQAVLEYGGPLLPKDLEAFQRRSRVLAVLPPGLCLGPGLWCGLTEVGMVSRVQGLGWSGNPQKLSTRFQYDMICRKFRYGGECRCRVQGLGFTALRVKS